MATEQIVKRLQALHPQCLIRDIQIDDFGLDGWGIVWYTKVAKDDSWSRVSRTMVI